MEGVLFAIGDPLLDVIAEVPLSLLEKHSLVPDHGCLMTDELRYLRKELESGSFQLSRVPGGSELNCFKMVQRLIGVPKTTSYIGCIGRDSNGEILKAAVADSGINAFFQYTDDAPTGVCYVCLTGVHRTLVTEVGAALTCIGSFMDDPEMWCYVQKAKYFYLEVYSLGVRYEATLKIASHAFQTNKVFVLNLSTVYLCRNYKDKIVDLLPYVDMLFGNEQEAFALAEACQLDSKSIEEIALSLARSPKASGRIGRLIVVTRGEKPVIAVHNGCLRHFPVISIDTLHIQDTVGAGDTFVGGYFASLIKGETHEECMKSALKAAHYTIRQRGCEIRKK